MKRFCLCFVVFLAVLTCLVARAIPQKNLYTYNVSPDDIVEKFTTQDVEYFNNCKAGPNGSIEITGGDAFVVFDVNKTFGSLVLNTDVAQEDYPIQVFFDVGAGTNEYNSIRTYNIKGQNRVIFAKGGSDIQKIRIDIDVPYKLVSVDLHLSEVTRVPYKQEVPVKRYAAAVFFSLIIAAAVLLLDLKYNFSKKTASFLYKKRKRFFIGAVILLISGAIAYVAEYIIAHYLIGASSAGFYFSTFRFVFLTAIIFSIPYFIVSFKTADKKIENVFLVICLILGLVMVIVTPFGHNSWDTETHYKWALRASYWNNEAIVTQAEKGIMSGSVDTFVKQSAIEITYDIQRLNDQYSVFLTRDQGSTTIAHYPSGIFIAIGRMLGASFYEIFTLGKLANLLVYSFVCYFAIKKLKSGKMILIVLALFPTNLLLCTSYSYDYWVTAFGFLGMAYFVGELQTPEKAISVTDTIVMCTAFSLAAVPKLIYAMLLIIPFFMKREKIKKPKLYYAICTLAITALFIMFAVKSLTGINSGGDMRGGGDVNSGGQIAFILSEPIRYAKILFKFLLTYLSVGLMKEYIVNYGYCGMGVGSAVFIALMVTTAVTDKNTCDIKAYGWFTRASMVVLFLGMSAAIATALYVSFTPVACQTVNGCQPRYLIPLLFPLLSVVFGKGIQLKINRKVYNYMCIIPCYFVNLINIAMLLLKRWG